jgi:hypothetical protein
LTQVNPEEFTTQKREVFYLKEGYRKSRKKLMKE